MGVKLSFFLALMLLLPNFHCLNWQGSGVMPYDMLNTVWNYINTNFNPKITQDDLLNGDRTILNFAIDLSNELNGRFDRAWNVVVPYDYGGSNSDTVLYGYAFNEHWFWYNGFQMNDGSYVTFIIWKDYNCQTYMTYIPVLDPQTTYSGTDLSSIDGAVDFMKKNWRYDDPWTAAWNLAGYL